MIRVAFQTAVKSVQPFRRYKVARVAFQTAVKSIQFFRLWSSLKLIHCVTAGIRLNFWFGDHDKYISVISIKFVLILSKALSEELCFSDCTVTTKILKVAMAKRTNETVRRPNKEITQKFPLFAQILRRVQVSMR